VEPDGDGLGEVEGAGEVDGLGEVEGAGEVEGLAEVDGAGEVDGFGFGVGSAVVRTLPGLAGGDGGVYSCSGKVYRIEGQFASSAFKVANSTGSTLSDQRHFVITVAVARKQRPDFFAGFQFEISLSDFVRFDAAVTATSDHGLSRSLANASRREAVQLAAPESHASASATTWSTSNFCAFLVVTLSYTESHEPVSERQFFGATRASSTSTSRRVSHPSPSASTQWVNKSRSYPVRYGSVVTFSSLRRSTGVETRAGAAIEVDTRE